MKNRFYQFGKSTLAALLIGLILLIDAMAACPALHEMIHKDSDKTDHHCAVTMFAHGQVDSATVEIPIVAPTVRVETAPQIESSAFTPAIENLPQGRAPPAVSSSQV